MSTIETYHGKRVNAPTGSWVVYEYYKGFVNNVWVYTSHDAAQRQKDSLAYGESGMMNSPKHFSVRQVKE
jgi:hypothetical protein